MDKNYVEEGRGLAWLSYLGLLVIIPILLQKDNPFTRYHIQQGLALLIFAIIWNVIWIIPFIGFIVGWIGWVAIIVFTVMGIINALTGKETPLPLLGKIADKINF